MSSQNLIADFKGPNVICTMDDVLGYLLGSEHGTRPAAAVISNQNKMLRSFNSKENIYKNENGPDCTVSNNKFTLVTLYHWHWTQEKKTYVSEPLCLANLKKYEKKKQLDLVILVT